MFANENLKTITVSLMVLWFIRYYSYFSLAFSLESLGYEIQYNALISAAVEIVACILTGK